MSIFIWRRRNKVQPTQLVPWKSTSKKEDHDMQVPLHATALSLFSLIVVGSFVSSIIGSIDELKTLNLIIAEAFHKLWINIVIPYVMLFKITKTKKTHPVVPQGLQMHSDENDDDNMKTGDFYNQPMQMHAMEDEDDVDIKTEDSYSQPMEMHAVHDEAG